MILIGICLVVILVIFTVNIIRRSVGTMFTSDTSEGKSNNRAEAYRLLSYLEYDKSVGKESFGSFMLIQMSDWYDSYVTRYEDGASRGT